MASGRASLRGKNERRSSGEQSAFAPASGAWDEDSSRAGSARAAAAASAAVHAAAVHAADEAPAVPVDGPSGSPEDGGAALTLASLKEVAYSALPRVIDIWRTLDSDQSGHIALDEFTKGLTSAFPEARTEDIIALFRECDRDGNGTVEYAELTRTMRQANRQSLPTAV